MLLQKCRRSIEINPKRKKKAKENGSKIEMIPIEKSHHLCGSEAQICKTLKPLQFLFIYIFIKIIVEIKCEWVFDFLMNSIKHKTHESLISMVAYHFMCLSLSNLNNNNETK